MVCTGRFLCSLMNPQAPVCLQDRCGKQMFLLWGNIATNWLLLYVSLKLKLQLDNATICKKKLFLVAFSCFVMTFCLIFRPRSKGGISSVKRFWARFFKQTIKLTLIQAGTADVLFKSSPAAIFKTRTRNKRGTNGGGTTREWQLCPFPPLLTPLAFAESAEQRAANQPAVWFRHVCFRSGKSGASTRTYQSVTLQPSWITGGERGQHQEPPGLIESLSCKQQNNPLILI